MAQESWDRDPTSHDAMAMAASKPEKPLPSSALISDQSPNPNSNPSTSANPKSGPIPNPNNPHNNRSAPSPPRFHTQSFHLPSTASEMFVSRQKDLDGGASVAPQEAKKKRCCVCKKRTGPVGFKCRCGGGPFCGHHRYSDKHACPFDYRLAARIAIAKANPAILAPKLLDKI